MPSLKTSKYHEHKISINYLKQDGSKAGLIVACNEYSKLRLVYTAKRLTEAEKKSLDRVMIDMMYTCGVRLVKFKDPSFPSNRRYDILDKCFARANKNCSKPVEPLYYTCNYLQCYVHCGSKQRSTSGINEYAMCTPCKELTRPPPVLKRKRRKELYHKLY